MEPKKRWGGYVFVLVPGPGVDDKEFALSQISKVVGGNALRALREDRV